MSGPARRGSRATVRSFAASPYARPAPKKSSWSIAGLFNYFNPLRSRTQLEEPEYLDDETVNRAAAADSLSSRGHQISRSLNGKTQSSSSPFESTEEPPPSVDSSVSPTNATFAHDVSPGSPQKGLEYLSKYLGERPSDTPLTTGEAEELISIIKQSTPVEEHETFRFSSSPSTPVRGNSPLFPANETNSVPFSFSPSYVNGPPTPASSTRKLLKQNPNGTYRWEGGGSAKPTRNRFHSPAFGPSPRPSRLVLQESLEKAAQPIKTDTKRRRVGEEASTSSSSPSGHSAPVRSPAPAPSPTRAAQGAHLPSPSPLPSSRSAPSELKSSHTNGVRTSASSSHLRAPPKPSAPVVPSPLRQAWGQPSSPTPSSKSSDDGSPTMQRTTKAASYMSELIKEVTPVKVLAVSNPYQAASPVKFIGGKSKPRPTKRTRASGRASFPPKSLIAGKPDEEKETSLNENEEGKNGKVEDRFSAQAIIEATLPKGSKRSRAPTNLGKGLPSSARSPSPPKAAAKLAMRPQVEEVEDEEESTPANKKLKGTSFDSMSSTINGHGKASDYTPIIEEIDDDMPHKQPSTKPSEVIEVPGESRTNGFNKLPSGQVSTSMFPVSSSGRGPHFGSNGNIIKLSAIPKEPSKLRFSHKPESTTSDSSSAIGDSEPTAFSPVRDQKPSASSVATKSSFVHPPVPNAFSFGVKANPAPAAIPSAPVETSSSTLVATDSLPIKGKSAVADPKGHVRSLPITSLPVFSFDDVKALASSSTNVSAEAAVKEMPPSMLPQFDFDAPPVASTSTIVSVAPDTSKSFNWAAAGMKVPDKTLDWECKVCSLKNSDLSATKCSTCDSVRELPLKAPVKSFDWAASSMKNLQSSTSADEWTCSTCMLQNTGANLLECKHCKTARVGSSPSPSTSAGTPTAFAPIQKPVVQGFDWAAAGLKPPQPKVGAWDCGNCGLENRGQATKCQYCDEAR
ncbi:hypothetical protein D9757_008066 [Collybiopsis confluens]|uniref:RanBP2-type domain-containing protein n=1 Tax=Collybiopsis confluens TaxID=2823264 RepID=A0A8H5M1F3_9AGAR|nr:hypothetical protein D9757_008066 [Collybiopsis confluens]